MWDVSGYLQRLKQRFTQWFNRRKGRRGVLWEERFKSVLVEGSGDPLSTMAAYIDLNPVRAGLVEDPKPVFDSFPGHFPRKLSFHWGFWGPRFW